MTLKEAGEGKEYIIKQINTNDAELNAFLFSLGCYEGEAITVIAKRKSGCTVSIKDARYRKRARDLEIGTSGSYQV